MTLTRWAFQPESVPRPSVRPIASVSFAVGALAIRCWMSGCVANLAAWYKCAVAAKVQGSAATGMAGG